MSNHSSERVQITEFKGTVEEQMDKKGSNDPEEE